MKIVRISKKDEKNVIVHLEDDKKLFLTFEVLMKNGLRKGDDVSESLFSLLVTENQVFFIKQAAARYLARRVHSAYELRTKLRQKKYDVSLINTVIAEFIEKKYIDDYQFALIYADENIRNKLWGRTKLKAELFKRGISAPDIEKVLQEKFPDGNDVENAVDLAKKKLKLLSPRVTDERKLKEKIISYLYTKGYDYETSSEAVNQLKIKN